MSKVYLLFFSMLLPLNFNISEKNGRQDSNLPVLKNKRLKFDLRMRINIRTKKPATSTGFKINIRNGREGRTTIERIAPYI